MDQLTLPYRIALVALLVAVAAWFAVLKPKGDSGSSSSTPAATATATAPGVAGLSRAVDKAKGAVTQSQSSAATAESAAGQQTTQAATSSTPTPAATTSTPSATTAPKPATPRATTDLSAPVLDALAAGKVAVVLFSDARGADDAHVRAVVRHVNRRGGKVAVFSAPIANVGRYSPITRGVEVMQGPTLIVISSDRKAHTIVGYTDLPEVQQLVDDVGHFRG